MYTCRWPTELAQYSAYRGSSHRSQGAASHINDMVWLYRSPVLVDLGGRGCFICSYEDYLPSRRLKEGEGGVSALWFQIHPLCSYSAETVKR